MNAATGTQRRRRMLRALPVVLFLLLLTAAALLTDSSPSVTWRGPLQPAELTRIEELVAAQQPGRLQRSGQRRIELSAEELNLIASLLLDSLSGSRAVALRIEPDTPRSRLVASLSLINTGGIRRYANITAGIGVQNGRPLLETLHIGAVPLPGPVRDWVVRIARERLDDALGPYGAAELARTVRTVEVDGDGMILDLQWQLDSSRSLRERAREMLVSDAMAERLRHYARLTAELAGGEHDTAGLQHWLAQLFRHAQQRSAATHDPIQENRSILLTLALLANELDPGLLLGDQATFPATATVTLPTLAGRRDLARHFLTAAAISAAGGERIAMVLSNSKELHDARHGSGFDINDLMANEAGSRFGHEAVDPVSAARLQTRLASAPTDTLLMPPVRPEHSMDEKTFREQFDSTDSPRFRQLLERIRHNIDSLPLYSAP